MNISLDEIKSKAPDGATHYTPNGTMYIRVSENGFVEVWRMKGSSKWIEIPMTISECYVKPLN